MIIFRYLVKELLATFFASTLILLMIILGGRLIKTIAAAVAGESSLQTVLLALLLYIPYFLQIIISMSLFIGILVAYGRLYAESEMTVLTATGFSDRRLLGYTLVVAFFMMFFVGLCSLWMAPAGAAWIEELYEEESKVTEFEMLIPGRFQAMSSGNRVTYAESLSDDKKQMNRVFIADNNTLVVAERGTQFVRPETGSRFLELYEGRRYDLVPGSAEMKVLDFDHYAVRLAEQDAERRRLKKDAVPTLDLINSNNNEYLAQLHWRISLVVLVPVITLIAFPLSKVNPRQGRFAKLFPALILLILYVAGLAGLTSVVEKGKVSPWLSLWMVHLLFFVLGLFLIALPHIKRRIYVRRIRA